MRISMAFTDYSMRGGAAELARHLAGMARAAEDAGLDTVWVTDHLIQGDPTDNPDEAMLEAYTTLGFLAAQTRTVRLGAMVTPVTYRQPSVLVKAVTTLDVLSGGRAWFGVGAGYHKAEAQTMGLPLPPVAERFDRLDELLRLALHMWSGDDTPFPGRYHRLDRAVCSPQPLSRPHPPILVGGTGEQRTLRLVARYADACNLFDLPDGGRTLRHKLEVLAEHCRTQGRDVDDIEVTVSTRLEQEETPEAFTRRCQALRDLGAEHVVVLADGPWTEQAVGVLADVVESLGRRR